MIDNNIRYYDINMILIYVWYIYIYLVITNYNIMD